MLADRNYTVSGVNPMVSYHVSANSLHLVLDVVVGSRYNLTLVWNKHMSILIKVDRAAQVRAECSTGPCPGAPTQLTPPPPSFPRRVPSVVCVGMTMAT